MIHIPNNTSVKNQNTHYYFIRVALSGFTRNNPTLYINDVCEFFFVFGF